MRRGLLSSCGYLVLMLAASNLHAADADLQGPSLGPTTYITFEGGYLFDDSPTNADYDNDDAKLGDLDSLRPGDDGGQFRFAIGQVFDSGWDYKVALSAILLSKDKSSADYDVDLPFPLPDAEGTAKAEQDLTIGIADVELGYRPDHDMGGMNLRVFGGVRGIYSSTERQFETDDKFGDITGSYEDQLFAGGPRIGLDLMLPVSEPHQIAFVGSVSGSVLFGDRSVDEELETIAGSFPNDFSDSEIIWNVEAMAGVQVAVGERAALTIGYRGQQFGDLVAKRSDIDKGGDYDQDGSGNVLLHGPFAGLTVEIPPH